MATNSRCSISGDDCTLGGRVIRPSDESFGPLCTRHYGRWHKHGDPLFTKRPRMPPRGAECSYGPCPNVNEPDSSGRLRFDSSGLCVTCSIYLRENGTLNRRISSRTVDSDESMRERFLATLRVEDGHILFTGFLDEKGYGRIGTTPRPEYPNGYEMAHRYAWKMWVGPIPVDADGRSYHLDHPPSCPKNCVDPDHLNLLSQSAHMEVTNARGEVSDESHRKAWETRKARYGPSGGNG